MTLAVLSGPPVMAAFNLFALSSIAAALALFGVMRRVRPHVEQPFTAGVVATARGPNRLLMASGLVAGLSLVITTDLRSALTVGALAVCGLSVWWLVATVSSVLLSEAADTNRRAIALKSLGEGAALVVGYIALTEAGLL